MTFTVVHWIDFFIREEYEQIEKLIKSDKIKGIIKINENQPRTGEYLDVMEFKDQNQKRYIVTVYDSNMLEQDPEVIKIYSL